MKRHISNAKSRFMAQANTRVLWTILGIVTMACCGCRTPPWERNQIPPRDFLIYEGGGGDNASVDPGPKRLAIWISNKDQTESPALARAIDADITGQIFNISGVFQFVERSNLLEIEAERWLQSMGGEGEIPQADYLITAALIRHDITPRKQDTFTTIGNQRYKSGTITVYDAAISIDFRFYETKTRNVILAKNILRDTRGGSNQEMAAQNAIKSIQGCAKEFAEELLKKVSPMGRVLELRDEGQCVKISLGRSHGVCEGLQVNFIEYVTHHGETNPRSSVLARGKVMRDREVFDDYAWVDVHNYKNVNVRLGHYVQLHSIKPPPSNNPFSPNYQPRHITESQGMDNLGNSNASNYQTYQAPSRVTNQGRTTGQNAQRPMVRTTRIFP